MSFKPASLSLLGRSLEGGECGFGTWTSVHPFLVSQEDKIQQGRFFVLDYLLVPVHPNPHAFLDVCWGDAVGKIHHKLGELLHIDDVLGIIRVGVDDLCASRDLATDRLNLHRSTIDSVFPPARAAPTGGSACQLQDPTRQEGQVQCRTPSMRFFVQLCWHFASAYCYE